MVFLSFSNTFQCIFCDRSTIRKKFYKWKNLNVFNIAHNEMYNIYSKNRCFKTLFMDSTVIQNLNGSFNEIDYYYKIVSKKQIKLSVLSDNNNVPISSIITNPKIHDSKLIKPLINNIQCNLKNNVKILADKGYITNQTIYQKKYKKISMVTPLRKNQKKKLSEENKKLLKNKRYKIEQFFCNIKNSYKRIRYIMDSKYDNYNTFIIMAFTKTLQYSNIDIFIDT